MNFSETRIIRIGDVESIKPYMNELCKLYMEVFCCLPHNESLSREEIEDSMKKAISGVGGVLVLMISKGELIGFSSGYELSLDNKMSLLWDTYGEEVVHGEIFLFHRLAVKEGFRGFGLGERLIKERNSFVGKEYELLLHYVHAHNKVATYIYKTAGFKFIEPCFQILARS